jgi:hypothetical protein
MTVVISSAEVSAVNEFVNKLGCSACVNVSDASPCQAGHVVCDAGANGYGLNLTARGLNGSIDGASFQRMSKCIRLGLERNALTGTMPDSLVGSASPLLSLYLNSNRLSGTLPVAPASAKLEDLRLSDNQLIGTIPLAYFALQNIVRLHFNENRFSGDFPRPPVSTSQRLDNFYGGGNRLTGTIGTEWRRLTTIKALHFQGYSNQLNGTIPDLFATHRFAYFNFDNNALSGTIPSSLSRQSTLTHLNISHNMLSGAFVAPPVGDFCVIDGNLFDMCTDAPGARVLCCDDGWLPNSSTAINGTRPISTTKIATITSVPDTFAQPASTTLDAVVTTAAAGVDFSLIGGVLGGAGLLLLLLVAFVVVVRVIKRRRQQAAIVPTNSNYAAIPPREYDDVDAVRRPIHHYDSPASKLVE